ncbi:L-aspartate oxidase [Alicyclobacillus acidocaldarius]|uniref:L-aspartate oxidase n=1 Tax=Alicyclobacillus acidocaldarius subsp. acidocaldarius (strain ATCC 27009 / DSM 446 / BCRC 14685 / JCM 5260 / KCTC 1825 / NBRC 15652 / NCIMB 11725 / NRRL B-14509 / 104-IA) TaxID=521098 RepID=C8WSJ8_ALIAD|nr:L-aspartate oxidase [Alicyclobacillus acidocaldarius]ACV59483.1 L-aspartate oxidase [Alicyclobacillus acidocaldarius subsp. acidocaldarius DSM 446]
MEAAGVVIVGAGIAGLAAALAAAEAEDVCVIAGDGPRASSSARAQGGLAAAVGEGDDPELHAEDTLRAGAGLCDAQRVRELAMEAPGVVAWLTQMGVPFDRDSSGRLALGREGGHTRGRIVHAGGDATGHFITAALWQAVVRHPRIEIRREHCVGIAQDATGRAVGVWTWDGARQRFVAARRAVGLATGGVGAIFGRTSNPPSAVGAGVTLAYHAGATLANLEFVQFHPTLWLGRDGEAMLLSEALRGAGAVLVKEGGAPLFANPQDNLRTRDVVALAIASAEAEGHRVYLDATQVPDVAARFPSIAVRLRGAGLDLASQPIPVTPGAHFLMGGVEADLAGRTSVPGLFALGETACTGVHGANRLASNSLLECVVMGRRFGRAVWEEPCARTTAPEDPVWLLRPEEDEAALVELAPMMWRSVGLVRDETGLRAALVELEGIARRYPGSGAVLAASLIARSALWRRESRGSHVRMDAPAPVPAYARPSQISMADRVLTSVVTMN